MSLNLSYVLAWHCPQVVIRGNGIQLDHYAGASQSGDKSGFKVFIDESEWTRDDGQKTDREHLLMALADLTHILIEALEDSREVTRCQYYKTAIYNFLCNWVFQLSNWQKSLVEYWFIKTQNTVFLHKEKS